jgi:hypothetical protein
MINTAPDSSIVRSVVSLVNMGVPSGRKSCD